MTNHGRGVRAPGHVHDGRHFEPGNDRAARVLADDLGLDDLFDGDNRFLRRPVGPARIARVAPELDVAETVCAVSMKHGDIRLDGG